VTFPLQILLLEDNILDAELVQESLEADYLQLKMTRVQTRSEFLTALDDPRLDLILADYKLPAFDGLSALSLAREARPDVPFIFVSGTLGEEVAIEAVKDGATDYVVKSRLSRLVPSVRRALREAEERLKRKKAEEALRQSEMYLAEAQRLSHTGSFGWDPASGEIYWSNETYRIFECDLAIKPTVQLVLERTHPDDRERLQQFIERVGADRNEFVIDHRLMMADGSVKFVRVTAHCSAGKDPMGLVFVGAITDITERERAEEALRESEAKFRDYAETASDWFWEIGPDYKFTQLSENAFGSNGADRIGTECWDNALDLQTEPEKWRLVRATLDARKPFRDFVYCSVGSNGSPMYVRASGKPVFDCNGEFRGYRGTGTDTTAIIRAQRAEESLRAVEAELAHVNRVTTLGELAASIAHEVKQPIAAARNNARAAVNFLGRQPPDLDEVREALECIVGDTDRAGHIIDRIRDHIKKAPPRKDRFDLNIAINEVIVLARNAIANSDVSARTHLAEELSPVDGDRVQLQQVILNLILNAVEAMSSVEAGARELLISTEHIGTNGVRVAVRDTGPGIDPEHLNRIFEAFYTTKSGGVGMGLSICRSIIDAHGGRLWAEANEPRGAIFRFTLPRAEKELVNSRQPSHQSGEPREDPRY
jgi:signal transduction histidine kinase/DNA-binding response OmpR family regulator